MIVIGAVDKFVDFTIGHILIGDFRKWLVYKQLVNRGWWGGVVGDSFGCVRVGVNIFTLGTH
jgi:hypothetical protein